MGFWETLNFAVKAYIWLIKHIDIFCIVAGIAMTIGGIATGDSKVLWMGLVELAAGIGLHFLIKWWKNRHSQN